MKAVVVSDDQNGVNISEGGAAGQSGSDEAEKRERESRSLALEKAYVHDVYDQLSHHFSDERYRPWPRVRSFLEQLEPGSIVCDAGCGNGKYLAVNPSIFVLGSDRCAASVEAARRKNNEVLICDALNLPYRDESFDAALSVAVIHHLATRDRRVRALRELARILRVGGRILITVWAKEQRHRKFESQDILVPWRTPDRSSSEEKSQHEPECSSHLPGTYHHHHSTTTTNTSDEDVTHYHAYTQTSESDSCSHPKSKINPNCPDCLTVEESSSVFRRRNRHHHKGRSVDPHRPSCSSQSSSDLSSPSDSCYSFVRKALQKLASTRRAVGGGGHYRRSWFNVGETANHDHQHCDLNRPIAVESSDPSNELPIELRHLDSEEDGLLPTKSRSSPPSLGGGRSDSVVQLFQLPVGGSATSSRSSFPRRMSTSSLAGSFASVARPDQQPLAPGSSRSLSLSDLLHSLTQQVPVGAWLKNRLSEEDPTSITTSSLSPASEPAPPVASSPLPAGGNTQEKETIDSQPPVQPAVRPRLRPLLIKQKRAVQIFESYCEEEDATAPSVEAAVASGNRQKVFKQGSMNDSLLSAGRLDERERLKRSVLPRQTTWSGPPPSTSSIGATARLSPLALPPPSEPAPPPTSSLPISAAPNKPAQPTNEIGEALKDFASIRNGFARIWQSLRGESPKPTPHDERPDASNKPWLLDSPTNETPLHGPTNVSYPQPPQQQSTQLFQHRPSLLEKRIKSFCGWATMTESSSSISPSALTKAASPSPRRVPPTVPPGGGEEDFFNFSLPRCCAEQDLSYKFGGTHPHRLSYHSKAGEAEGSSDSSSKDSSLQSDTSVDSEDSCVSVIYIPRPHTVQEPELSTGTPKRQSSSSSSEGSPVVKVFPTSAGTALPVTIEVAETTPPPIPPPSLESQILPVATSNTVAILTSTAAKCLTTSSSKTALVRSMVSPSCRPAASSSLQHRLLSSFEVFNPETDDVDSDSDHDREDEEDDRSLNSESSSSSTNSAGSVISVGDPMWPAFQDRRQTILSGSSLDIPTTSSCDGLVGSGNNSEQGVGGDNSSLVLVLAKQDSNDSWPASIETDPASSSHLGTGSSRANLTSSPAGGNISNLTAECCSTELHKSPSPVAVGDSSVALATRSQQEQQQADVEEWRLRSSLGPLDECHEEEANETTDRFRQMEESNRPVAQLQTSQQQPSCQQQWKLDRQQVKSSFSASTSSLDSSVSAPSFSSARQSSSASALSVDAMLRKNSDDSAVLAAQPLLPASGARRRPAAFTSASSAHHHHLATATSSSSGGSQTAPSRSTSKPSCDEDGQPLCFKPLNKLISSADRQRSADRDSSLSVSTSQDSLPSDVGGAGGGGGAGVGGSGQTGTVTLHRYYHVFRQGELDQLIERYVENLHIITSYYDHANWCVVAEKVHVWTI